MAARNIPVALLRGGFVGLLMAAQLGTAQAAEFVGRVVDAVEAKAFAGIHVCRRGNSQ